MSKIIYVTKEALRMAFNKDYDMKLPKDTKFVLTTESNKEREQNYVADLEAKLAEKESWYYAQLCENEDLERQLAEEKEYTQQYRKDCAKIQTDYYQLKEQLAEKDEQIKDLTECNQCLQIYRNKDKISFCIEKLEKVKEFVKENESWEIEGSDYSIVYADDILEEIENQIEELKKENR